MFNLGISELLIIGAIALLIFGPDKLPGALRSLSKFLTYIRRTTNEFKNTFDEEVQKATGEDVNKIKQIGSEIKNNLNYNNSHTNVDHYLEKAADVLETDQSKNKKKTDQETQEQPSTK